MNMNIETQNSLNEIYEGLTNGLSGYREQDLAPGCKRVIVRSEMCTLTFDFISKTSGLSATDSVTVEYADQYGFSRGVINSSEQALQMVQEYIPEKAISSGKHR